VLVMAVLKVVELLKTQRPHCGGVLVLAVLKVVELLKTRRRHCGGYTVLYFKSGRATENSEATLRS
jgi:hypothetical protein